MTPSLRSADVTDVAAVLALWQDAHAQPSHTDDLASLRQLVVHDSDALIVAEVDGRIIGSVIAGWDGWRGSIYRLVVAPDHRRRGLGRYLLAEAERRLAAAGAIRSQAIVLRTDRAASGFWRASGWHQQSEQVRFVKG